MSFEQAESNYLELVQAALEHGDGGAWAKLRTADFTVKELQEYAESIGYHVNVDGNGSVISYTKDVTAPVKAGVADAGSVIDSNLQGGTAVGEANTVYQTISDVVPDVAEGATATAESAVTATGSLSKFVNGVKTALNTQVTPQIGETVVAGKVVPPIIAASIGIKLGKGVDGAIYNIGKAMGLNPPEELNPEMWSTITQDMSDEGLEGVQKWAFNTIFGIDNKGNTTMYVQDDAVAYMTAYLKTLEWFDTSGEYLEYSDDIKDLDLSAFNFPIQFTNVPCQTSQNDYDPNLSNPYLRTIIFDSNGTANAIILQPSGIDNSNGAFITAAADAFNYGVNYGPEGILTQLPAKNVAAKPFTHGGKTVYYGYVYGGRQTGVISGISNEAKTQFYSGTQLKDLAWAMIYGLIKRSGGAPDGVTDLDDSTQPDLSNVDSPTSAVDVLKELFPELWDNRIENQVVQPDGSTKTYTYLPMPFPISGTEEEVTTDGATQTQQKVNPKPDTQTDPQQKPATESQLWSLIQMITNSLTKPQTMTETEPKTQPDGTPLNPDPPTNPPDTGTGEPPAVVPPTGSASSLWAIYNPTIPQINDFGAWLWSPNFVDQILKLFNDPMQSIIGLHRVYATPVTGETRTIKVGYLDSGVPSLIVTDQYSTVDCGTVNLREYFGNVLDYDPYTQVQLYLPFIGIVNLDVADVMRSSINIVYHVDVLTGACLAEVKVIRDAAGGTLYQYAGNAAVTMPISSGSYMGIVASIASIAGGVAGTIASGGAMAPMLLGSASSALGSARTKVEHSGGFSGNAGAMGIKKPYLIISRPQAALAKNYQYYIGDPSNTTTTLGSCSGYVQVKECHLENIPATQQELSNIEQILKGGVLI